MCCAVLCCPALCCARTLTHKHQRIAQSLTRPNPPPHPTSTTPWARSSLTPTTTRSTTCARTPTTTPWWWASTRRSATPRWRARRTSESALCLLACLPAFAAVPDGVCVCVCSGGGGAYLFRCQTHGQVWSYIKVIIKPHSPPAPRAPRRPLRRRGKCDDALVECTNKNSLFKIQSRYVVERCDPELWDKVTGRRRGGGRFTLGFGCASVLWSALCGFLLG